MPAQSIDLDLDGFELDPEDLHPSIPLKQVPAGDVFEASRAGDVDRLRCLLESGVNVNARDRWDSVALYYACLAGHVEAARMLLEAGAICSEHTFDGDRCHYAALNLRVRRLLKAFEARPPPLAPLPAALRDTFLSCPANRLAYLERCDDVKDAAALRAAGQMSLSEVSFPPDITFYVDGRPIEAHRVILSARSPFFKRKFELDWKERKEVRFSRHKLSYSALYSLIHFFYSDRLEVAVEDMEDLARTCKACKCEELHKVLQKELIHQKYAEYKSLKEVDNSQKRFILQGLSLPEEDRLPFSLRQILQTSLAKSLCKHTDDDAYELQMGQYGDDLADVCIKVGKRIFRCHQVLLASRSEYFQARLSRMTDFLENDDRLSSSSVPFLEEHELSTEVFEKMIEYMYTDGLKDVDPDQAGEIFDAASRYLLFSLKRAVADALLSHLEMASPAELCHWVILSDMYGVTKIREYCLDMMACNFETFARTREFRAILLTLPPPSGDSSLRTTRPSAPGSIDYSGQANLLDDLREKWLEAEGAELDKRDESAVQFDKRLEMLMLMAENETVAAVVLLSVGSLSHRLMLRKHLLRLYGAP
ncbi:BTB/POZ domain-containing protein At2g04740 isoform X2 [Phalaenopsis equestris]|uniref:BTB/POZ domain-containing protein At2g04740 isoform X2 n=1 Tax=Phalaenopsis equestris TaxID=78828 RepID=UPI0009E25A21|nr:BTB/POZ domain-containing protein At2g04740 isoform X2 [Phalaenopsis equestris]